MENLFMNFVADLDVLRTPAEPLKFISENGIEREEGDKIIAALHKAMAEDSSITALAAPQIGENKRIFCIRFDENIKTFIDPIIIKKSNFAVAPEVFLSMPGKEILISRPEEITVVYYTADFKYEENKLLGPAARIFDQCVQLLEGILPDDLGLVSDIEADGSLSDLTEDEAAELLEFYKTYVATKAGIMTDQIKNDPELRDQYRQLDFAERVTTGKAAVVAGDPTEAIQKARAKAALTVKQLEHADKTQNKANLKQYLGRKGKSTNGKKRR